MKRQYAVCAKYVYVLDARAEEGLEMLTQHCGCRHCCTQIKDLEAARKNITLPFRALCRVVYAVSLFINTVLRVP